MTADRRYTTHEYRAATAELKKLTEARGLPCWICGKPIDMSLRVPAPGAFTADHVQALADGGPLLGLLRPCHFRCNSSRGGRQGASRRRARRKRFEERHPGLLRVLSLVRRGEWTPSPVASPSPAV